MVFISANRYWHSGNSSHLVVYLGDRISNLVVNALLAAMPTAAGTTVALPQRRFASSMWPLHPRLRLVLNVEHKGNAQRGAEMPKFTVQAAGRDPLKPKLNLAEASQMAEAGFRFAIFDPAKDEFNVSRPYQLAQDMTHGTLTFMQDEGSGHS